MQASICVPETKKMFYYAGRGRNKPGIWEDLDGALNFVKLFRNCDTPSHFVSKACSSGSGDGRASATVYIIIFLLDLTGAPKLWEGVQKSRGLGDSGNVSPSCLKRGHNSLCVMSHFSEPAWQKDRRILIKINSTFHLDLLDQIPTFSLNFSQYGGNRSTRSCF